MKVNPAELWTYTKGVVTTRDDINKVIQWNLSLPLSNHYTARVVAYLKEYGVTPLKQRGKRVYKHIELTPVGRQLAERLTQGTRRAVEQHRRRVLIHEIQSATNET